MSLTEKQTPAVQQVEPIYLSRGEFLDLFGEEWAPGQHVTFLGPTQRGKTTLSHQMLAQVVSPEVPVYMLALKPPGRDPQMAKAPQRLNLNVVSEYPDGMSQRIAKMRKRNGYVIRPEHVMKDHDATNKNLRRVSKEMLVECYASKTPVIIDIDETHITQNDLGLKDDIEAPLMRGAPVVSVWCLIQRGRYITYHAYAAPEWVIIFFDPDRQNRLRYSEIGGVDPRLIESLGARLRSKRGDDGKATVSEAIVIRRSGPKLFIVATE